LMACLLWPSASNRAEARCGYPELPFMAQLSSVHFENFGFFEEGQLIKVFCEHGLLGHKGKEATTMSNYSVEQENFMTMGSEGWIECRNSRWNATGLRCLRMVELDPNNIQVK